MLVEKFVSYQIEKQFPTLFLEDGQELVSLVTFYYEFLENTSNQSVYNNRRIFEYRDIDNTLENMVIFFKNKFMSDLPIDQNSTRFAVKHILDLYRRRGTPEGIELFFNIFYKESIEIYYPARNVLKPSSSTWVKGVFLQLYPVDIVSLKDLLGKNIVGSISKAEAVVDRVVFTLVNNTFVPILSISNLSGNFIGFDDVMSKTNNVIVNYGKVYGSLDDIEINVKDARATTGNNIGDIFDVVSSGTRGGKVIVSSVTENITGEITYTVTEGGFGYTTNNTRLYVSSQIIFSANTNDISSQLVPLEYLEDQYGNRGIFIAGTDKLFGVRMDATDEFVVDSIIQTTRSSNNIIIVNENLAPFDNSLPVFYYDAVVPKNETSPGPLYPEDTNPNILSVQVSELDNAQSISLITDIIQNYANVAINSSNYNSFPALTPMSGNTSPITLSTQLDVAFDLTPFTIGSIKAFANIKPGLDYKNRVFAVAHDPISANFDVYNQLITLEAISPEFSVGGIITQDLVPGKILNITGNVLTVLPYSYYGFNRDPITYRSKLYNIVSVARDYSSKRFGDNAVINTVTEYAVGKILSVNVINSGYGYVDKSEVLLQDDFGETQAVGIASARGQGIIEGKWSSTESHLNIQDGKFIQDSDFYQEYSYQISSRVDINTYKNTLNEISHLAGTKMFGKFLLKEEVDVSSNISSSIRRKQAE
jgi:hypothetical protein